MSRVSTLDEAGDRNAPEGTRPWAVFFLNRAKLARRDLDSDAQRLRDLLVRLKDGKAWKALDERSFNSLCRRELQLTDNQVAAIASSNAGDSLKAVLKRAPDMPGQGRRTDLQPRADGTKLETHGSNQSSYLAARLKRDRPDIVARIDAGEFKSIRAAAIAAGIVKVKTALEQLHHWWARADMIERKQFLDEVA